MSAHLLDDHYKKLESLLSVLDQIFITGINHEIANHLGVLEAIESNLNSFARMKPEADKGIGEMIEFQGSTLKTWMF